MMPQEAVTSFTSYNAALRLIHSN